MTTICYTFSIFAWFTYFQPSISILFTVFRIVDSFIISHAFSAKNLINHRHRLVSNFNGLSFALILDLRLGFIHICNVDLLLLVISNVVDIRASVVSIRAYILVVVWF